MHSALLCSALLCSALVQPTCVSYHRGSDPIVSRSKSQRHCQTSHHIHPRIYEEIQKLHPNQPNQKSKQRESYRAGNCGPNDIH
jgi:hypothetical protein